MISAASMRTASRHELVHRCRLSKLLKSAAGFSWPVLYSPTSMTAAAVLTAFYLLCVSTDIAAACLCDVPAAWCDPRRKPGSLGCADTALPGIAGQTSEALLRPLAEIIQDRGQLCRRRQACRCRLLGLVLGLQQRGYLAVRLRDVRLDRLEQHLQARGSRPQR